MNQAHDTLKKRHLRFGWYALLTFLCLGALLEVFHGFKLGFYLNVDNEARRLMWRLAHAHGTLLALLNIVFATSLAAFDRTADFRLASACLIVAALLLPGGFFLAGVFAHSGDPGVLVLLVPLGALVLFAGVLAIARRT